MYSVYKNKLILEKIKNRKHYYNMYSVIDGGYSSKAYTPIMFDKFGESMDFEIENPKIGLEVDIEVKDKIKYKLIKIEKGQRIYRANILKY